MTHAERWIEITSIYDAVMATPPEQRDESMTALCGDDESLRREVEALLSEPSARRPVHDSA